MDLDALRFLASPRGREAMETPLPGDPLAAVERLRKLIGPERAPAAMELRKVRERAAEKFPPGLAQSLLGVDVLIQQASSLPMARYAAWRLIERTGASDVWDLCCGLGADAIGAALEGLRVRAVDRDETAAFCAEANAELAGVGERVTVRRADATGLSLPRGAVVHIDPDRRATGRRVVAPADYEPPEAFLRELIDRTAGGAMKLSPALDRRALPDWPVDLEYLSAGGTCRQLLAHWPGIGARRATVVRRGECWEGVAASLEADPSVAAPIGEPGAILVEPDPAVPAAGATDALAARFGLRRIDPALDWLFGERPVATPLARCYRVFREVPGRLRDLRGALAELDAGTVIVKPRGLRLDTDALQKRLAGPGGRKIVALWCRTGRRQRCFLAEPL